MLSRKVGEIPKVVNNTDIGVNNGKRSPTKEGATKVLLVTRVEYISGAKFQSCGPISQDVHMSSTYPSTFLNSQPPTAVGVQLPVSDCCEYASAKNRYANSSLV